MSASINKPIYALAAALGIAVIFLGMISMSTIAEKQTSSQISEISSDQELDELKNEIAQLKTSIASGGTIPVLLPNNQQDKTITVTGMATYRIEPDKLQITLGVQTNAETAQEAVRLNAQKMENVTESLIELGIDEKEIRTSYFSLYPDYSRGQYPKIEGFNAQNTISITTSADKIPPGKIIDIAIEAGANRVDNVNFAISPDLSADLWEKVIANAVNDARVKAEKIIQPLDMQIVGVKSIEVSDTGFSVFGRTVLSAIGGAAIELPSVSLTPIYSSDQEFRVNVNVTFLIA